MDGDEQYRSTGFRVLDQWFWVEDDDEVYVAGKLISYDSQEAIFERTDGSMLTAPASVLQNLSPAEDAIESDEYDLMSLTTLDTRQMLHHFRRRVKEGLPFTEIGDILITFNPNKEIPGLFGKEKMMEFKENDADTECEAHIYQFAQKAYSMLLTSKEDQSIIICGESGSGSTFIQHQALEYLLTVVQNGMADTSLVENIPVAISILECFGSAATERHSQSTMFGIWIRLMINTDTGKIIGCAFEDYLLNTNRLREFPNESDKERSFHVLELIRDEVPDSESCRFLPPPNAEAKAAIPMTLDEMKSKLDKLGCTDLDIDDIIKVMKAVILLGTIKVEDGRFDDSDKAVLQNIYKLLGVEEENQGVFQDMIMSSTIQVTSRNISMPTKQQLALEMLDKTAKFLYTTLFRYLLLNFSFVFRPDGQADSASSGSIGICNFPGFEVMDEGNDFIELMENWAAEKMCELYLKDIFSDELDTFNDQKVNIRSLLSQSAMQETMAPIWETIKLLEQPARGLISIIDKHTSLWRSLDSDDDGLLRAMNEAAEGNRMYQSNGNEGFIISHFGGETKYDITDFIKSNDDYYPAQMGQVFAESADNEVLNEVVDFFVASTRFSREKATDQSVAKHFGRELNDLMDRIQNGNPHFVRSFRMNSETDPDAFDSKLVWSQMQSAGLQHVIQVRNLGLPHRVNKLKFVKRYARMHSDAATRVEAIKGTCDVSKVCEELVDAFWNRSGVEKDVRMQIGSGHVFMSEQLYSAMESMRDKIIRKHLVKASGLIKAANENKQRKKVSTIFKMIKMGLDNDVAPEQFQQQLDKLQELELPQDMSDAIWQHHIVLEAAEKANYEVPEPPAEVEYVPVEYEPDSWSATAVALTKKRESARLSIAMQRDGYRASMQMFGGGSKGGGEVSSSKMAAMKQEYQAKINKLKAQLIQAKEMTAHCVAPCQEFLDEKADLEERLERYEPNFDGLSVSGLTNVPELEELTVDLEALMGQNAEEKADDAVADGAVADGAAADGAGADDGKAEDEENVDEEDVGEESSLVIDEDGADGIDANTRFQKLASAVYEQLSDYNLAVRIAQDLLRHQEQAKHEDAERQRASPDDRECQIDGLDELHIGLDKLNLSIQTWADMGEIGTGKASIAHRNGEPIVPMYMHQQNKLVLDSILRDPVSVSAWNRPIRVDGSTQSVTALSPLVEHSPNVPSIGEDLQYGHELKPLDDIEDEYKIPPLTQHGRKDKEEVPAFNVADRETESFHLDSYIAHNDQIDAGYDLLDLMDGWKRSERKGYDTKTPRRSSSLQLALKETKDLISTMGQKYLPPTNLQLPTFDDSGKYSHSTSRSARYTPGSGRSLGRSVASQRSALPSNNSDNDVVCMLLQDVDLVEDPKNAARTKVSDLQATTTISVGRKMDHNGKEYAHISQPMQGWILVQDEYGNPNLPLLT